MKIITISLTALMCFAGNAFSECKDYEFTELNKMSEQQMVDAFEDNLNEKNRINQDALGKNLDRKQTDEFRAKTNACISYNDKIMRAFKSKFPGKNLRKPPANRY